MTKQTTKLESSMARNNIIDKGMSGAAAAVIVLLAFDAVLKHVRAAQPASYLLAGAVIAFLSYLIVAPIARK